MVSPATVLFAFGTAVSVALCALGYYSYRRWDEPGVVPFAVFVGLLGLGGVTGGVLSIVFGAIVADTTIWPTVGFVSLLFWSVPWALFVLQYTGKYTTIRRRTVGLLLLPLLGLVLIAVVQFGTAFDATVLDSLLGGGVLLYVLGLLAVGIYLLFRTTYEYGHLSLGQGVTLSLVPVVNMLLLNTATMPQGWRDSEVATVYIVSFAVPAAALLVALFGYDTFESAPAVGAIGERALVREMDDLVFVVDDCDRIIRHNEAAVETLALTQALGTSLDEVLGEDSETLDNRDSLSLETTSGTRRYDPQVSPITDQHERDFGSLVSLHDVTERELREQRLAVLNRVLRHNLRNKVEVVKSHAEVLDDQFQSEQHVRGWGSLDGEDERRHHVTTITETADAIAQLGESARAIDRFVSQSNSGEDIDLVASVEQTLTVIETGVHNVTVSLDLPASAPVRTNREALDGALTSALENAVKYADSEVSITVEESSDGYDVVIADDGPGIPEGEIDSLDAGTETPLQHGTGLGLWQLNWAVTTMGGDLSFETNDGTTVVFTVPHQPEE